jgi:hypothetical protein
MAVKFYCCLLTGILLLTALTALAVTDMGDRKSFIIPRTESPPTIDGTLDDDVWRNAAVIDDFHQTDPGDGLAPTENTIVRVLYDDDYLYIAADLRDRDPDKIQATQMIQGRLFFSDDRFWVTLDSFNSKRNDYLFQVNANGVRREALRENNARFIEEWVAIWHAQSALNQYGWATEIAIPFKSISFDPNGDTWGVNFGRGIVRKQEINMWSSHERQDWPAYSGEMSGISGIEQGRGIDVTPSANLIQRKDFTTRVSTATFEPSLDVLYKITPSLNATFTLNTDFSTAEVDDQQVALDRFSLFFPEKRDFFLQDAGIFEFGNIDTNGRPFFSRRIGLSDDGEAIGIDGGAKLTGRIGSFNIGMLAIRQEAHEDVGAKDLIVARGSMNVFDESALGMIFTDGDPTSNDSNSVIGTDFLYRNSDGIFSQIVEGKFWLQKSSSTGLDGQDQAWGAYIGLPNDRVDIRLSALEIQENFRPALGFVNRTGIRRYDGTFRYRTRPEKGMWRAINNRIDATLVTDMAGDLLSRDIRIRPVTFYSHRDDFLMFEWQQQKERVLEDFELFDRLNVPGGDYEFDRYRAEIATGRQRPIRVVLSVQDGGFFGGDRLEKFVEVEWRQSAHLFVGASFTENVVDLPSGSFTSHLASLRTDIAFNSRWSWSNLIQYDNSAELVGLNSRLRFMPDAGREVLVVVNHGYSVDALNSLSSTSNELNLKFSYTFRY